MKETVYQKQGERINNKEVLSLDTIMVLRIGPNDSYIVTMSSQNPNEGNERVTLRGGKKEEDVVKKCIQANLELERKSIVNYMPSDYIEIYNEALRIGEYDICLTMLRGLESHINQISKERNKVMRKARTK